MSATAFSNRDRDRRASGHDSKGLTTAALLSSPVTIGLLLVAAALWVLTVIRSRSMGNMPGTMNMSLAAFVLMWTLMMAAMMLPSMSPFAVLYSRAIRSSRWLRVTGFAHGYLVAWALTGVVAYFLAWSGESVIERFPDAAAPLAAGVFVVAGVYQLTPLKVKCLRHCRSPIGHVMHFGAYRGRTRDVRAGFTHGLFCLGCCWALMLLMVAFGIMNVWTMVGLAAVIATEKMWRHGEHVAKAAGFTSLALAVAVLVSPSLAPGLDPNRLMDMTEMDMTNIDGTGSIVSGARMSEDMTEINNE